MIASLLKNIRRLFPNLMKAEELYIIEGSYAPLRSKIEDAMQWLISAENNFEGLHQLRRAYALNMKPLRIAAEQFGECQYMASSDFINKFHTIIVSDTQLKTLRILDVNGVEQVYSLKRLLAHELEHAGQLSVYLGTHGGTELAEYLETKNNEYMEKFLTPEQQKHYAELEKKLQNAASQSEARIYAIEAYDGLLKPMEQWSIAQAASEKKFDHYFNKVERPALQAENRVALRLNEPLRSEDYLSLQPTRSHTIETLLENSGALKKPEFPAGARPKFIDPLLSGGKNRDEAAPARR